ncbi:MAG: pyridoxal phosphate-dependent aminotransferase [Candidatus Pacebacteria bacterium]|nr:pyridoxal phosphate-dependent aminotransferase [Candidatus Paceibacterota bacterium]MDD3729291.1 pyridoxal phosphate-dependent aminotransferase [Candidatus Paceibacterota bacterium]MDD4201242.1 pyridoxal phosphate-dependent aminotransferase [Candidatus Paceibacterota bacterium]MDD5446084.1 pyridoxal phosphate-dependent aminotransferase [Candidatus Paceibacterota bacterium]
MKQRSAIGASGHKFRTKNISKRAQRIVISPIKEMSILADNFKEETGENVISFGQGIPYFDTPSYIKEGIKKSLDDLNTAKYTLEPGITELRELIAKNLQKEKGIKNILPKKEVMVTVGCQEAMACAIATVIDNGDEILIPSPGFASHIEQVLQFGGVPVFFPLNENKGWKIEKEKIEKKISKKTKAIIFSNPSNPTGSVLGKKEIEDLANIAIKHDLIIITDETYDFLVYDNTKHISLASVSKIKDRIILCGSFSKKYAMTGYRVGYAFSDQGIIDHMLKVHDALAICAPAISQKAAIFALSSSKDSISFFKDKLSENRDLMCKELDKLDFIFQYQKPKGAYYILVKYKIPKIDSFNLALKILKEAKVVVIPGAAFGPTCEKHIRFSFACSKEEIKEGFKRLNNWAKNIKI